MTKVIIPAFNLHGHVAPMLYIAKELISRGHEVTVITGSFFKEAVEKTGAGFVPLLDSGDFDPEDYNDPERLALQGLDRANYDMERFLIGTMAGKYKTLQKVLAAYGEDQPVVLTETGFAMFGAGPDLLGAPGLRAKGYVVIGTTSLTHSSMDTAPFGMGLDPDSSEEGRARNMAQNEFMKNTEQQKLYEKVLTDLGVTAEIPYMFDIPAYADSFLQLSVEEINYKRSDLPKSVRFIGALPTPPSVDVQLPAWWPDVLAAEHVVVVTQGTASNGDFGDLIEPTLEALADLPVLVIAATGSKSEIKNVPANARVVEFVPFVDLLPHTSVLVTNGGFGGTQQALSFGVPMVLAGETEDKLETNVRTAHTGAAINLKTQKPTPEAVREAVKNVLSNPSYLKNAHRLQAEFSALDPYTAIEDTIVRLAAK
ncbi:nucleotide disphospho-sugar-binding domain-containing protein [Paenibacillus gansuensis]|uniref:Nucleotide disphospho-sugar-binding domain-containing protein n=1 Tax=Paenibacillus gansuensis TaxID=306542 RepID=A0ABW5PHL4_9BACL